MPDQLDDLMHKAHTSAIQTLGESRNLDVSLAELMEPGLSVNRVNPISYLADSPTVDAIQIRP